MSNRHDLFWSSGADRKLKKQMSKRCRTGMICYGFQVQAEKFPKKNLTFVIIKSDRVGCQASGKRILPHDICATRFHVLVEVLDTSVPWHFNDINDSFRQVFEGIHVRHLAHHDANCRVESKVKYFWFHC